MNYKLAYEKAKAENIKLRELVDTISQSAQSFLDEDDHSICFLDLNPDQADLLFAANAGHEDLEEEAIEDSDQPADGVRVVIFPR